MIDLSMAAMTSALILSVVPGLEQTQLTVPTPPPTAAQGIATPPVALVRPVAETYFGQTVVDPYRWMEQSDNAELAAWMKAQDRHTREMLDRIPGRKQLLDRVRQLDNAGTSVPSAQRFGGKYFYLKGAPGSNSWKLYMRDGSSTREKLLIDPDLLAGSGTHVAVDYYSPSWDGRYVAYGLSPGGSEESVLHVLDATTGTRLADEIDRAQFANVAWRTDNRSFFYTRLPKLSPDAPPTESYRRARVYLHVLGANADAEKPLFGYDVDSELKIADNDVPFFYCTPRSPWVIAAVNHGVQNEMTIWASRARQLGRRGAWKKIAGVADEVTAFDIRSDSIYLLTHRGAPRFKVVRTSLLKPDLAHARTVVAPGVAVITAIAVAADALYLRELDGGLGRLRRLRFGATHTTQIATPFEGSINWIFTNPIETGVLILMAGWTHSPEWLACSASTGKLSNTGLSLPSPVDMSGITSEEVRARSADGTMVPLSIVRKRDFSFDGSHPTWLSGYGAYGMTLNPGFSPTRLAFLERGGVLAFAHVRGGGEFGDEWHRAGMKETKMNTIADFIACARYLIDHRYTTPAHLAGDGASAGGITIGGAITQQPELFGAALIRVGDTNALRSETMPSGPSNVPEFGTFTTEAGFKALYAMDAYQHVKDGTPYPAAMLTTGANDPRVSPWQAAKMAARLQAASTSGKPILLRVDYDVGHVLGSTKSQRDEEIADEYSFLLWQLGDPAFQP